MIDHSNSDELSGRLSWLSRREGRSRILAVLPLLLALAVIRDWLPTLTLLAITLILSIVETGTIHLKRVFATVFPLAILLPWSFRHEESLVAIGPLTVAADSLRFTGIVAAKLATVVLLTSVLSASAPLSNHANAAGRLGVPSLLTQLLTMSWRYVFLFREEWSRLRTSLRVRGFSNRLDRHGRRTTGQALGAILVRSHDRAERVGWAMKTRAFDGRFRSLDSTEVRPSDLLMVCGGILVGAMAIGWDAIR